MRYSRVRLTRCVEPRAATGMTISMINVPTTLITVAATSVALNNSLQPSEKVSPGAPWFTSVSFGIAPWRSAARRTTYPNVATEKAR